MCGITGFWSASAAREPRASRRVLERMTRRLAHRGPDAEGFWLDPGHGVGLGHRRLSILDLSDAGAQPMNSASGRHVLVYNGEVYNYRALRRELEHGHGVVFRGESDTEVLLEAIEHWGLDAALRAANGMFALALFDRLRRRLVLARDRVGVKPLYYARCGRGIAFASELKALRAHPEHDPRIDRRALAAYLRHGAVPGRWSIYQETRKLAPGTCLELDARDAWPEPRRWWSAVEAVRTARAEPELAAGERVTQLEDTIAAAVEARRVSDVPLGAFLSGGVDSSLVVALLQAQASQPVHTFTIGFREPGFDEAESAAAVARHLGTDHQQLYVGPEDVLDVIPSLPTLYDEPFADSSQLPTYLVSQLARRKVGVALSGDGGDELFGGYNRHVWGPALWRRLAPWPARARRGAAKLLAKLPPDRFDALYARVAPLLPARLHTRSPGEKLHKLAGMLPARDPDAVYRALVSRWAEPLALVRADAEAPEEAPPLPPGLEFAERMMLLDLLGYLPDDVLTKVDRASMAVGLEVRVPLLDPNVISLAWRLPLEAKIGPGGGKWILREVLARHLPRALFERPKMGFALPLGSWLRGPLRSWAEALLAPERLHEDGLLHPAPIRRAWEHHLAGRGGMPESLWNVLVFLAWQRAQATQEGAQVTERAVERDASPPTPRGPTMRAEHPSPG